MASGLTSPGGRPWDRPRPGMTLFLNFLAASFRGNDGLFVGARELSVSLSREDTVAEVLDAFRLDATIHWSRPTVEGEEVTPLHRKVFRAA